MPPIFIIEHALHDTGALLQTSRTGGFAGRIDRQLLPHLTSGAIRLGNMAASEAYFATADYVSMHNHDTGSSADALYEFVTTGALQNAIAYTTPTIAGLRADVQYSLHEGTALSRRALALNYDLGALHLGLGHEAATDTDRKSTALRALYELGAFTIGGYYERTTGDTFKRNNFRLAGAYALWALEAHVNAGSAGDRGAADKHRRYSSPSLSNQPEQAHQGLRLLHEGRQRRERHLQPGRFRDRSDGRPEPAAPP
ncbi:MAG: porin [Rhizobacter sp.]|nr:porin [Rhizobacter sp.]